MKTINLKDYYPYYAQDTFVDVSDELFSTLLTVGMELSMTSCLFLSHPMRFTNVSSQVSSSTLPLLLCRTSRQSGYILIILWA